MDKKSIAMDTHPISTCGLNRLSCFSNWKRVEVACLMNYVIHGLVALVLFVGFEIKSDFIKIPFWVCCFMNGMSFLVGVYLLVQRLLEHADSPSSVHEMFGQNGHVIVPEIYLRDETTDFIHVPKDSSENYSRASVPWPSLDF